MFARLLLVVLAFAAYDILLASEPAAPSKSPAELALTLSAPQLTVKAGGPMMLTVTVKNISNRLIGVEAVRSTTQEANYAVMVREEHGNEARTTAYHRLLRGKPSPDDPVAIITNSEILWPLDPGKTTDDPIDLAKLYSLAPGVYSVQVERLFCSGLCKGGETSVRSNILTITVTP
jgi:hypothetical protein